MKIDYKLTKRFFDIFFSAFGLFITSPILFLTALLIKLDSKGPVFFVQERLGLHGKSFKMIKFRSMCVGAEKGGVYEKKADPRVTRVGKIIRKTSIDELPQFINILKGEMSIIGPRPVLTYHPWNIGNYSQEQLRRFEVRPGVTGWAQVNGRKVIPWSQRIKFDIEYVNNISLKFDVRIFLKTIIKVLSMKENVNISKTISK